MDRACCVSRSRLCAAATPTQLITPLFISNNGRGWNKSEPRTLPASSTRKVQTGTLKRASGFKRYSLSFLMERNRKWRREAGLLIYTSPQSGERKEQVCLPVHTSGLLPLDSYPCGVLCSSSAPPKYTCTLSEPLWRNGQTVGEFALHNHKIVGKRDCPSFLFFNHQLLISAIIQVNKCIFFFLACGSYPEITFHPSAACCLSLS